MVVNPQLRQCRCCKRVLPAADSHFYHLVSGPQGLHPNCIQCCKVSRALEAVRKRDKSSKISVRQRVRAQSLGITYEEVYLVEVYRIRRGICGLCLMWVMPKHASMDHIRPLSKGGTHHYVNIQLTHLLCNLQKSNKYDDAP
jgi:hypothetical protein